MTTKKMTGEQGHDLIIDFAKNNLKDPISDEDVHTAAKVVCASVLATIDQRETESDIDAHRSLLATAVMLICHDKIYRQQGGQA